MRAFHAFLIVLIATTSSCSSPQIATHSDALAGATVTYFHAGFAAGPALFTDDAGRLIEERRYEPFGVPIDAHFRRGSGDTFGPPDFLARDTNALDKRTEAVTGWSDHGARWLAPELARWTTPDPPVAAPDVAFMFAPWTLHPYQYVGQNPVAFSDPDGRCAAPVIGPGQVGICIEAYIATSFADHWGPIPVGDGNDRSWAPNDSTKTNKIQQLITVDLESHSLSYSYDISHSHALIFTKAASGGARVSLVDATADGATFIAGGHAVNGFSGFPGAPKGSIDYAFKLHVDNDGQVSLESGVHKGFPSYAVYAYHLDESGQVVSTALHEVREREIGDLQAPFNGLHDDPPGNARGVQVQTYNDFDDALNQFPPIY
jgi:RHS repeat-associated protein